VFGVFQQPAVALLPMIVLFVLYASRIRLPGRIPPAFLAIGIGAGLVAVMRHFGWYSMPAAAGVAPGIYLPRSVNVFGLFGRGEWWSYLTIILPLGALDTLASLQILESVKAAGDDFETRPSLLMNGVGTLAAACLGSPFPTTLYVGHAAHKANGARSGYSALNGLVTLLLCLTGVLPLVLRVIPLEVAGPVIVWFGLVTVGQAFVEVHANQAIAVTMGLIPMLAQWATSLLDTVLAKAGSSLAAVTPLFGTGAGSELALGGLIALGQGGLLTSMLWAATLATAVQRRFLKAAAWMAAAAVLSAVGVIHAYALTPSGVVGRIGWWVAPEFALAYAAGAVFLVGCEASGAGSGKRTSA
jgi:AGZA family xanthine/uracil permease-like MFS transporter